MGLLVREFTIKVMIHIERRSALTSADYRSVTVCTYGDGFHSVGSKVGKGVEMI